MVSDGKIDGQFLMRGNQTFYKAIGSELGLTENEINNISGSVWDDIYSIVNEDESSTFQPLAKDEDSPTLANISKKTFNEIVKLVNEKLGKNIKVYDEETVNQTSSRIKVNISATEAQDLAKNLKDELKSSWVKQSNAKNLLSKINPGNVSAILDEYPEIADDIDGVFAMGFGFDKNEVYNYILKPLIYRAKELDIPVNENSEKNGLSKESTLSEMKSGIKYLQAKIKNAEHRTENNINYQDVQRDFNKATNFLAELSTGNLNVNKMVQNTKYQGFNVTSKTVELEDGRQVFAIYNDKGEIKEIRIKTKDSPEIVFTEENAGPENLDDSKGFNPIVSNRDYDFNAIKNVVAKLLEDAN